MDTSNAASFIYKKQCRFTNDCREVTCPSSASRLFLPTTDSSAPLACLPSHPWEHSYLPQSFETAQHKSAVNILFQHESKSAEGEDKDGGDLKLMILRMEDQRSAIRPKLFGISLALVENFARVKTDMQSAKSLQNSPDPQPCTGHQSSSFDL